MHPARCAPRAVLALSLIACAEQPVMVRRDPPPDAAPVSAYLGTRALMVPVAGVGPAEVPDTYAAQRSGGRLHQATDIPAPRGTPVVSVDDGRILRVGQNRYGGNMIYATDPAEHLIYYYAHLDRIREDLGAGQQVRRGELLGYVGSTGNASPHAPHLHFQLMRHPGKGRFHGGPPIDARPYFALPGALPAGPAFSSRSDEGHILR